MPLSLASATGPSRTPWSTRLTEHWMAPKAPDRTAQARASPSPEYAITRTFPASTARTSDSTTSPRRSTSTGQEWRWTTSIHLVASRPSAASTPAATQAPLQSGSPGTP